VFIYLCWVVIKDNNIEYLEHMTDAYLRCKGKTLQESFQYAAIGLVNIMYDTNNTEKKKKVSISAEGFDLENLLFDWLEKVLLLLLIDKTILSEFNIFIYFNKELNKYYIDGYGEGDLVDIEKHELKVEIKGITYHEMKIFKESYKDEFVIEYIVDL
jgi:SHS2 domain-containing protein